MELSLSLLGETEVRLNGMLLDNLSAQKAHALLFYLVVESHHAHRRDALAEMFWPEKPQGFGRNNLKQTLSLLRNALTDRDLDEPFLLSSNRDLQFNIGSSFQVDVQDFEDLTKKVAAHPHTASVICDGCEEQLILAVKLYRDDFLSDFYLLESPEFNEWVLFKRESYKRLMGESLSKLISFYESKGVFNTASKYGKKLVELEPWSELNHRRQMALLAASGKRSAALKQYHSCKTILKDEFNVKPTQETSNLYETIKEWKAVDGNQEFLSIFLEETPNAILFTEDDREQTSRLKYWVVGSFIISITVLIWFAFTNWIPAKYPDNSSVNEPGPAPLSAQTNLPANNPNQALVLIYDQTGGSNWIQNEGWLGVSSPCEWFGITCQGSDIVEIRLPNNNLEGHLPKEIGDLLTLQVLDLSNNILGGPIPLEFGYLVDLEYLDLGGNFEISGQIPPEIGNLRNLEDLVLSSSGSGGSLLSGEIPPELGQLVKLDKLIIEDTVIQGSIPTQLGNLSKLTVLSLSNNNLSGPIPDELYNLSKLRSLDLWSNHNLNGTISSRIGQLTKLDFLNLSQNYFSGNLPHELGNLSNLEWIGLHDNTFTGALPTSMIGLDLSVLEFDNTNLCEPADLEFQSWLDTITKISGTDVICDDNSISSPTENDPYQISSDQACLPGEGLLYLEDFQDKQAQGWPEIDFRAQNWDIVPDPYQVRNLVVQNPGLYLSESKLQDYRFGDAVWRVSFMKAGNPEYGFVWHHDPDPYQTNKGQVNSSEYNIAFQFDGTYFFRGSEPMPHVILLGIRRSIQSNRWHELEISTYKDILSVWLDGEELLAYQDPDPLPGGIMGLALWESRSADSMVYFDNFRVCEINAPFVSAYPVEK